MNRNEIKNFGKKNIKAIVTVGVIGFIAIVGYAYYTFYGAVQTTMINDFNQFEEKILSNEVSYKVTYYYKNEMMLDKVNVYEYDSEKKILTLTNEKNEKFEFDTNSEEYQMLSARIDETLKSSRDGITMKNITVDRKSSFYTTLTSTSVLLEGKWKIVNGTYDDGNAFSTLLKDDGTTLIEKESLEAIKIEIVN